jgi:hypothetical protein
MRPLPFKMTAAVDPPFAAGTRHEELTGRKLALNHNPNYHYD